MQMQIVLIQYYLSINPNQCELWVMKPLSPQGGLTKKTMIPVSNSLTGIFVFRGRTNTPPCGSSSAGNSVASPSAPDSATTKRFLFTDSLRFAYYKIAHGGVNLQPVNTWSI